MTQPNQKKGPAFVQWFGPLLDALRELGGSATPKEAVDAVARICQVPQAQRDEVFNSGQGRFAHQVHWARLYLVWAGFIENAQHGVWALTAEGLKAHLDINSALELFAQLYAREFRQYAAADNKKTTDTPPKTMPPQPDDAEKSDEDKEFERFIVKLRSLSAKGFERLCLRLLREAGFDRLEVTGRSNDGGIDGVGVLQVNELVGFNVVFQCKKWATTAVPPKEIRDLRGAMAGRADKAIFLTTSYFSQSAKDEAIRPGADPVELVDGEKLYEMFKKYGLGLRPRTVYDIDNAFFEQFE
ncbi:MAG: restriction endonuclease [Burkholderiaceae bacterium]|nr:restriction endonuclease [Burkholderiaceae bacterium]